MTNLIKLNESLKKLKAKKRKVDAFEYSYRKPAKEMDLDELRELVDDIDEVTTCCIEELESVKVRILEIEELNAQYVDLIKKIVELITSPDENSAKISLSQIKEWIADEAKLEK